MYNSFRLENKSDITKYADIILDFSYFKVGDAHEHKIENNEVISYNIYNMAIPSIIQLVTCSFCKIWMKNSVIII